MDLKTKKRLKKLGVKNPRLKKRDRDTEFEKAMKDVGGNEWPPELPSGIAEPALKPLPIVETIDKLKVEDERYRARKALLIEQAKITEKQEFVDYIRKFTDDGLDLVLFAWGVLKAEGYEYGGCVIDIKAKVWACEYLTDRAFGKAQQNIKIDSTIHNASDEELLKEVRLLQEKLGKKVMDVEFKTNDAAGSLGGTKEGGEDGGHEQAAICGVGEEAHKKQTETGTQGTQEAC